MKNYQYYGLFFNISTKDKLMNYLTCDVDYNTILKAADRIFLDHCTLMHISQREDRLEALLERELGRTFQITLTGIGISNKAIAFKVERKGIIALCKNTIPHITIATIDGGKPVDSNNIICWKDIIPKTITVVLKKI